MLGRSILSLDNSWQFIRQNVPATEAVSYNDSAWTAVSLPHTWNNLDGQDGGNNYYRGIGWDRKHYTLPAEPAGQKLVLQFDGANLLPHPDVTGTFGGEHPCGLPALGRCPPPV